MTNCPAMSLMLCAAKAYRQELSELKRVNILLLPKDNH